MNAGSMKVAQRWYVVNIWKRRPDSVLRQVMWGKDFPPYLALILQEGNSTQISHFFVFWNAREVIWPLLDFDHGKHTGFSFCSRKCRHQTVFSQSQMGQVKSIPENHHICFYFRTNFVNCRESSQCINHFLNIINMDC